MLADSEIQYLADKVFVHRWPHDTPLWGESIKKQIDDSINKNSAKKSIKVKEKTIQVEDIEFTSLKKIGISVPFFKNECTMIFEARFGDFFSHVHITIKSENFLDVFNQLILWRQHLKD